MIEYFMAEGSAGKRKLETVPEERDLGIIIRAGLKPSSQCNKAATATRRIIGMVRRNFKYLDIEDFNLIYKTYIHPCLLYTSDAADE